MLLNGGPLLEDQEAALLASSPSLERDAGHCCLLFTVSLGTADMGSPLKAADMGSPFWAADLGSLLGLQMWGPPSKLQMWGLPWNCISGISLRDYKLGVCPWDCRCGVSLRDCRQKPCSSPTLHPVGRLLSEGEETQRALSQSLCRAYLSRRLPKQLLC